MLQYRAVDDIDIKGQLLLHLESLFKIPLELSHISSFVANTLHLKKYPSTTKSRIFTLTCRHVYLPTLHTSGSAKPPTN